MKKFIALALFGSAILSAQGQVCRVSNAQVNGYVLTATTTGGNLCAWQVPTGGGGGGGAVSSVFGRTGAIVANTGDYSVAQITGAAPLASPHLTGVPTAPTAAPGNDTTQIATTAFVTAAIGGGGCPTCLLGTPSNHGLVLSSATQTTTITGAGSTGQAFLSGGSSADGAYGALNLAGGSGIVSGILPALNLPTGSAAAKGILQGDGSTLTISGGIVSCTTATTSQIGCLKPDGTSVTIAGGVISVAAGFGAVSSVFGRTGNVVATSGDYSVGQVTGAAALVSPAFTGSPTSTTPGGGDNSTRIATTAFVVSAISGISTGVTSFNTRTGAVTATSGDYSVGQVTGAAPLASPSFSGVPTGPTATPGTNTTQLATTAFVTAAVSSGPVTSVFSRTGVVVATSGDYSVGQVTGAAPIASPTFTGIPAGPTAAPGTNTTQLATTAFVTAAVPAIPVTSVFGRTGAIVATSGDYSVAQITGAAPLANPTFSGIPAAPTAAPGTNTTQIATTAFVTAAVVGGGGATIAHTLHIISGDGAGNGIDSGIGVGTLCGGCAASIDLPAGTPTGSVPANTFRWEAPATVTAYTWHPPGADGPGFIHSNGSGQLDIVNGFTYSGGVLSAPTVNATTAFTLAGVALEPLYFGGSSSIFANHAVSSTSATQGVTFGASAGTASFANSAVGYQALTAITSGNYNTAVGHSAGGITTGSNNTIIGHAAGQQNTTACTFVGDNAIATGVFTDCMALGRNTSVSASFRAVIGDGSVTDVYFGSESALATIHCANCGGAAAVTSFNTRTGAITLLNTDVNALAPITLGSSSFTGSHPFQALSAGAFDDSHDYSPVVGLLGPAATSVVAVNNYINPNPPNAYFREAGVIGASVASSTDLNVETDGVIGMAVALNCSSTSASLLGIAPCPGGSNGVAGSVAGSFFGVSGVAGGTAWGLNTLVRDFINFDISTHKPSILIGMEMDASIADLGSTLAGININIDAQRGQPTKATYGINLQTIIGTFNPYWTVGYNVSDHGGLIGLSLGRQPATTPGGSTPVSGGTSPWDSATIDFTSGHSILHVSHVYADENGKLILSANGNNSAFNVDPSGNATAQASMVAPNANFTTAALVGPASQYTSGSLPGSVLGAAVTFNAVNVAGTWTAQLTGNRSGYIDMTNSGIDLVITPTTQTGGSALSGPLTVLNFNSGSGAATFSNSITVTSMPTSGGGTGGYVCRDAATGTFYVKSVCP